MNSPFCSNASTAWIAIVNAAIHRRRPAPAPCPAGIWCLSLIAILLALGATGCATRPHATNTVVIKANGDPGVTVVIRSTAPGVPEQVATVPATLEFHGGAFELRCVHGTQPGRLALSAHQGGLSISTGDTTRPGETTVFKIRPNEISVTTERVGK